MRKPLITSVFLHVLLLVIVLLDPSADGRRLDVDVANSVEVVSLSDVPALASLGTPVAAPRGTSGRREAAPTPPAEQPSRPVAPPTPPSAKPPAPGNTETPGSGGPAATLRDGDRRAEPAPAEPARPTREETAVAPEPVPAPKPEPKSEPDKPKSAAPTEAAARPAAGGGTKTASPSTTSPPLIDFTEPKPPSPPADTPPAKPATAAPEAAPVTPQESPPKPDAPDFASVLQRVEDLDAADRAAANPTPQPAPEPTPDQITALLESDVPQLGQADQVTADEIAALRRQIEACWNVPAGVRDAGDLIVRLRVVMNPDGTPSSVVIDDTRQAASGGPWQAAADSARRAVLNPRCHPFRLPPEKFETWKHLVLTFNPQEMLNR